MTKNTRKALFAVAVPPVAEKVPHWREIHGDRVLDNYYWMYDFFGKGPSAKKVLAYLDEENAYFEKVMNPNEGLREKLFEELKERIKEDDQTVPVLRNGYYYYRRTEEGKQYFKFCRRKCTIEAPEEVLLDVDEMAHGNAYFAVSSLAVSEDNRYLAFGVDTVSRRQFIIYIKDLETGKILDDRIFNTEGDPVWANNNQTFFYTSKNEKTLLSEDIYRHKLGTPANQDVLVYHETDNTNYIGVGKSRNRKYIFIISESSVSSEWRMLEADKPDGDFRVFQPREEDVLYSVYPVDSGFFILTNKNGAENFKLMKCPVDRTAESNWEEVVPHREDTLLEGVCEFKSFLALQERQGGLPGIRIRSLKDNEDYYIDFGEPDYVVRIIGGHEYQTHQIRYFFSSMITPTSTIDFDVEKKEKEVKKEMEVGGGFDKRDYENKRIYATSGDGTRIPISLVYKKSLQLNRESPLLLYGYGSYGISIDPTFSNNVLSLLNRGFIYAIAHVRGGQEMGRKWYLDGKLDKKKNTFDDFISCARYLIAENYTSPEHLYAMGGSAGGLLMGAVINMAPELWNGVVAQVPFVDVVNTMLDESIPLTTNEFDEWGNPKFKEAYDYIKSYSPYENVERKDYPNLLVVTGLHDSQVQYFEPAKWVAKLREMKTGNHILLLSTEMDFGHGGASGRFDYLKNIAKVYGFILSLEGIGE